MTQLTDDETVQQKFRIGAGRKQFDEAQTPAEYWKVHAEIWQEESEWRLRLARLEGNTEAQRDWHASASSMCASIAERYRAKAQETEG